MPEEKESAGVEQPPPDPSELLRKLEALIREKSEPLPQRPALDCQPPRVSKSWIWAIIIPIIVLAGIAVFAWIARRHGRELAKLRHEKNKAKILAEKEAQDLALSQHQYSREQAQKKVDAANEKLRVVEADLRAEEARYEAELDAINRMRGWDGTSVRKPYTR